MSEAMAALMAEVREERLVLTNGFVSREGFGARDREASFYMLGSMGLASSIAMGVALARPGGKVVALDGDGALLTNLGALAFAGAHAPKNFYHVVFDNGVYASTGNQRTIASRVSLLALAGAAGYRCLPQACDAAGVAARYRELLSAGGPGFLLVKVEPHDGSPSPRVSHTPVQIRDRFKGSFV
ncbi:MAG: thiamine pyrophosphate-dependent enzyme [Acidobacteriota bacterium]